MDAMAWGASDGSDAGGDGGGGGKPVAKAKGKAKAKAKVKMSQARGVRGGARAGAGTKFCRGCQMHKPIEEFAGNQAGVSAIMDQICCPSVF